jgi:hypothetical protein
MPTALHRNNADYYLGYAGRRHAKVLYLEITIRFTGNISMKINYISEPERARMGMIVVSKRINAPCLHGHIGRDVLLIRLIS